MREGRPLSKKARVDAYPVEERYGWIWVFPGDLPEVTRVPIPQLKFMHIPSFRHVPDPGHLLAASCSVGGDDADGVEAVEWFPVPTAGGCAVVYVVNGR